MEMVCDCEVVEVWVSEQTELEWGDDSSLTC